MNESYMRRNEHGNIDAWFEYGLHVLTRDDCFHIWRYHNGARPTDAKIKESDYDYIHICDLDEFIDRLQQVARGKKQ